MMLNRCSSLGLEGSVVFFVEAVRIFCEIVLYKIKAGIGVTDGFDAKG